ncbi:hypothetical protein SARC_00125 [Sphaeroforma arctica JP610]|uniref:Acid phosphatase n=1 Tax=Sphaeroforma arctica JP610 TaxID=667725 RepID=A0A0L0GHD5_9EUKA|nr:hypothetical protein SARC_00125 [Sphaeroforma arctica JP610]KNC87753.1 hypothetical protein SARC_00125 [Sphaeroforma arctica JP610]|eukprot:XP_014161655.1 hypothetical protein SARC_00125 [Sphaeroforma arctica JP610]
MSDKYNLGQMEISFSRKPSVVVIAVALALSLLWLVAQTVQYVGASFDPFASDWKAESSTFAPKDSTYIPIMSQILFRHGDRTAVTSPIPKVSYPAADYYMCDMGRIESFTYKGDNSKERPNPSLKIIATDDEHEPVCEKGLLTAKGCRQHVALGGKMLQKYGNYYLQTSTSERLSLTQLHATNYDRTHKSLACFLKGFRLFEGEANLDVKVAQQASTILHPNSHCQQFVDAISDVYTTPEWITRWKSHGEPLVNPVAHELGIAEDELLRYITSKGKKGPLWESVFDQLHVRMSHALGFPGTLTQDMYDRVRKEASVQLGIAFSDQTMLEIGTMALMQMLYDEMDRRFTDYKKNRSPNLNDRLQLRLYSGHDTTIIPMLCAMAVYDDEWPGYASHFDIQLAVKDENPFVRVYYQNSDTDTSERLLKLPGCAQDVCTLKEFKAIAYQYRRNRECDAIP